MLLLPISILSKLILLLLLSTAIILPPFNNIYTKEEINNRFDNVPTVENTYTKAEVDKAIANAIKALIPAGYEFVIKKKTT